MAFRYTKPPYTQNVVALAGVVGSIGVMNAPGAEAAWRTYLETTPAWFHFCGMVFVLHALVFWGAGLFFGYVERHNRPAFIARYRIQTDSKRRPCRKRVATVLAWNQLFWTPLVLIAIAGGLHLRGWAPSPDLPSAPRFLGMMALLTISSAIYFYASHRFLHRPWWMRNVHKLHHEFRTSTAIAAEYAHWVEFVFGNFGTLAIGVLLFAPTLPTIYVYTVLATLTFVVHHSGFAVPWLSWSVHHDWHHYRVREAFGTFGHLDRWTGTDDEFKTLHDGQVVP